MWRHVVLWALLLTVTEGAPADEPRELREVTACPLTYAVLAWKITDPGESCVWMKDDAVLFDTRSTTYSFKRNESYENVIIHFASEKDSGTYECKIRLSNGSYKHGSTYRYKLHVRNQEECNIIQDNTRQDNNSSNNCYGTNVADILAALFSALAALFSALAAIFGAYLVFYPKLITMIDESARLKKTASVPPHLTQVLDGSEVEVKLTNLNE